MRQDQFRFVDHLLPVEEQIEVKRARTVGHAGGPVPAELTLNLQEMK